MRRLMAVLLAVCCLGCNLKNERLSIVSEGTLLPSTPAPPGVTVEIDREETRDGDGSLKVTYAGLKSVAVKLTDPIPLRGWPRGKQITYQARMKLEDMAEYASLAMWTIHGDGREVSYRGHGAGLSDTGFEVFSMPIPVDRYEMPSLVLGVWLDGPGTVWLDSYRVDYQVWSLEGYMLAGEAAVFAGFVGCAALVYIGLLALGKRKQVVLGSQCTLLVISVLVAVTGVVLLAMGRPVHLWFPYLWSGGGGTLVLVLLHVIARRRYGRIEARRLAALDAAESLYGRRNFGRS